MRAEKIKLATKICSICLFAFSILVFAVTLGTLISVSQNTLFYNLLNFGVIPSLLIFESLLVAIIVLIFIQNLQNYKNPMVYLLLTMFLISFIFNIVGCVRIKPNSVNNNYTLEFWLLLISSGISVIISTWLFLEQYELVKPLSRFIPSLSSEANDEETNNLDNNGECPLALQIKEETEEVVIKEIPDTTTVEQAK